jgi:hypothetical protein
LNRINENKTTEKTNSEMITLTEMKKSVSQIEEAIISIRMDLNKKKGLMSLCGL